jgi:hypothetical protein
MKHKEIRKAIDQIVAAFHKVTEYFIYIPKGDLAERAAEDPEVSRVLLEHTSRLVPATEELFAISCQVVNELPELVKPPAKRKRAKKVPAKKKAKKKR